MEILKMVGSAVRAMDDKKGENIKVLDVQGQTNIADYFVICSGNSTTQTKAIADFVEVKIEEEMNLQVLRREGFQTGNWILLDYGSVIVQVFRPEDREYYNLEKFWGDSEEVDIAQFLEA